VVKSEAQERGPSEKGQRTPFYALILQKPDCIYAGHEIMDFRIQWNGYQGRLGINRVPGLPRIREERNHYAVNRRTCQSTPSIFTLTSKNGNSELTSTR
jgi:hypothetical protein